MIHYKSAFVGELCLCAGTENAMKAEIAAARRVTRLEQVRQSGGREQHKRQRTPKHAELPANCRQARRETNMCVYTGTSVYLRLNLCPKEDTHGTVANFPPYNGPSEQYIIYKLRRKGGGEQIRSSGICSAATQENIV